MEIENIKSKVFRQYESIRKSGITNMFDLNSVRYIAKTHQYRELVEEIDDGNYSKILKNYGKAVELGIIERN